VFRHAVAPGLALVAAACAFPLRAQSVPARASLEELRQRLGEVTTADDVRALERALPAGPEPAVRALRRGFVAIRMSELDGDRRFLDDAIRWFDEAALHAPKWPYPWFGLALTKVELHRRDALVKASWNQGDGVTYLDGYIRAFTEVFARDSVFAPAIELLRRTLAGQGERQQPEPLLVVLRRVAAGPAGAAADALILARDRRRRGLGDSALVLLDLYRRRGGDPGVAELERAHTLASLELPDAASAAWLAGIEQVTPGSRLAYRLDLRWIADSSELAAFDRAPDDSLAEWAASFWAWRDASELRLPGERLQEHLRRWAFMDRHYRVVSPERRTQFARVWAAGAGPCSRSDPYPIDNILGDSVVRPSDGRHRERLYDDRAYVYMRHGAPALRIGGKGPYEIPGALEAKADPSIDSNPTGMTDPAFLADRLTSERMEYARANESWLYWFDGARRVFHFEGTPFLGLGAPTTLATGEPLADPVWLELRGQLDPIYSRLAYLLQHRRRALPYYACQRLVQQVAARTRSDASAGLRTDSYTLRFPRQLDPVVQVYGVGHPGSGTGRILVVFALPGEQLKAGVGEPGRPPGVLYPLETRISATDSASRVSRALDSIRHFLTPDTLRKGSHLTGYVELPVPPGLYRVGTAFFQPAAHAGGTVLRDGLDLRLPASGLYLSDLVLGRETSNLAWTYRGESVPLNPLGAFPRTEPAEVFYELSGLLAGRTYVTSMELAPVNGGPDGENIRLRFTQIAENDEQTVRRKLGLERLQRGQYQLSVEITEEGSSRKVRRVQYLTIAD